MRISLHFVRESSGLPALCRTVVAGPDGGSPNIARRGNLSSAHSGSFQWSFAVQALSVLLLRYKIHKEAALVGFVGSLASSLDFAVAKEPSWLMDMFGTDSEGKSRVRSLLLRFNPERKRPGPVEIRIRPTTLAPNDVSVFDGETQVDDDSGVSRLLEQLEVTSSSRSKRPKSGNRVEEARMQRSLREVFRERMIEEVSQRLNHTEVFDPSGYASCLKRTLLNPTISKLLGNQRELELFDTQFSGFRRLGIGTSDDAFKPLLRLRDSLRVAVEWSIPPSFLIFRYMQQVLKLPIEVDSSFLHSAELSNSISHRWLDSPPDLCLVSSGIGATMLRARKQLRFGPLMLGPGSSMTVLRPKASTNRRPAASDHAGAVSGRLHFMSEMPVTGSLFFKELLDRGVIKKSSVRVQHSEPDSVGRLLAGGDPENYGIVWFPFCAANQLLNGCEAILHGATDSTWGDAFILARDDILADSAVAASLAHAIRIAWRALRYSRVTLEQQVDSMLDDSGYFDKLSSSAGFSCLPDKPLPM